MDTETDLRAQPPQEGEAQSKEQRKAETWRMRGEIMNMTWPCIVELTMMSLLGMADTIMVGQALGSNAINAVSITDQPVMISFVLFQAFNVGGTALAARFMGANDILSTRRTTAQVLLCNFVFGIIVSALLYAFARPLLWVMGAQASYIDTAEVYLRYAAVGVLFTSIPSAVTALLRATGNTRIPMQYNILANLVNIGVNALLITGPGPFPALGVEGAAIATLLSKVVACAIALSVIFRPSTLPIRVRFRDLLKIDFPLLKRIATIGLPAAGEQVAMRIGLLIFTRLVTGIGDVQYAAHSIAMKIQGLSFNVSQAFGVTATSFAGRYLGAKEPEVADRYVREMRRMGMAVSLVLAVAFFFGGSLMARAFTTESDVAQWVGQLMRIMAFIMPMQTSNLIVAGCLRGAGDTLWPLVATVLGLFLMRAGLAWVFVSVFRWGLYGAWAAFLLDQYTRAGVTYLRFLTGKWKKAIA